MYLDNINLNQIRVFDSVYRHKSMTKAADELHMTQSGVSQHIKSFEETLQVKLFDRVKQRLIPTNKANELFIVFTKSLNKIESALMEVSNTTQEYRGKVSIALPIEFGNNIVIPKLVKIAKEHPKLQYQFYYGHASNINALLLKGEIDFAFIDQFQMDPQISTKKVFEEELLLCCTKNYIKKKEFPITKAMFESLDYIAYLQGKPILNSWFKHHYRFSSMSLNVRATAMDVQGVARIIRSGLGLGVLPNHFIENNIKFAEKLHIFNESGKVYKNEISIAYLKKKTHSLLVNNLISFFTENS